MGLGRIVGSAVVVLAVLAGAYWLVRPPAATTESKLPYAGATTTTPTASSPGATASGAPEPTTTSVPTQLVVHVAGAVVAPGVHLLPAGARTIDAVTAAGGLTADANVDAVNLAAPMVDGQRVYVPRVGEVPPVMVDSGAGPTAAAPSGPVNVNTATADELDSLPGVGPSTAAAILAHRQQHGPFATIEELGEVRGIGPAKLEALRGLVMV